MGSTNKTTKLNLPQFVATDQPTWLGDMNAAFQAIDDGVGGLTQAAQNADNVASTAMGVATEAKAQAVDATTAASGATVKAQAAQDSAAVATTTANNAMTMADQANQKIQLQINLLKPVKSSIKYVDQGSNGYKYDIIRISGPDPYAITRHLDPQLVTNGSVAKTSRKSLLNLSLNSNISAGYGSGMQTGIGGQVSALSDSLRTCGLVITNGALFQDFGVGQGDLVGTDLDALVMNNTGNLNAAFKSDGVSGVDRIAAGAFQSFGGGPVVVSNGQLRDIQSTQAYSGFTSTPQPATILGQDANGNYIIIQVRSRSVNGGIKGNALGQLALNEGCVVAIVDKYGTDTQQLWQGNLVQSVTDGTGIGNCVDYVSIDAPESTPYDTGERGLDVGSSGFTSQDPSKGPVFYRQIGNRVYLSLNAHGTVAGGGAWSVLTAPIPAELRSINDILSKGVMVGGGGVPITVIVDSTGRIVASAQQAANLSDSSFSGTISWTIRDTY